MSKKILLPLAATLLISACASSTAPMSVAGAAVSTVDNDLHVERVVMLMRHGVRPPTKARIGPDGVADQPWPVWSVDFGELTHHGYAAVRLLGQWDRQWLAANDLLPAEGCPAAGEVVVAASAKSRTQDTARALIEGLAPGCGLAPSFPASAEEDVEFHPIDVGATTLDPDLAYAAVQALAPQGGMEALKAGNAERRLRVLCPTCPPALCATRMIDPMSAIRSAWLRPSPRPFSWNIWKGCRWRMWPGGG